MNAYNAELTLWEREKESVWNRKEKRTRGGRGIGNSETERGGIRQTPMKTETERDC